MLTVEPITNTAYRHYPRWIGRIFLYLFAQPADMHINGSLIAKKVFAPYADYHNWLTGIRVVGSELPGFCPTSEIESQSLC